MDARFEQFLSEKKLFLVEKLGKGRSSHVFLVKNNSGKKLVAKIERPESTRFRMSEREAENLAKANKVGVGPKLISVDHKKRIVLMEFVPGNGVCARPLVF